MIPADMTLATDSKELIIIYTSESSIAKQALGYAQTSKAALNLINISETTITGTQWSEVADLLGSTIGELVSKNHPDVAPILQDATFSDDDWIHFIQHNPVAIQNPIMIQGRKATQINTPSEVLRFISVDSAGLNKHKMGESPETSNTKDETEV